MPRVKLAANIDIEKVLQLIGAQKKLLNFIPTHWQDEKTIKFKRLLLQRDPRMKTLTHLLNVKHVKPSVEGKVVIAGDFRYLNANEFFVCR